MHLIGQLPQADEMWLSALRAAGRSPHTFANYGHAVAKFKAWRGDDDITTASRFEALRFVQHLSDQYQPGGVANRVRSLRTCFSWLLAEEMVESNPFSRIEVTIPDKDQPTATDDEVRAMLSRAKGSRRDYALLCLLVDTGCRKGEIAALTVKDFDLTSGVVHFPVSKTRARTVPLTHRAIGAVQRWMRYRGVGSGSLWSVGAPYQLVRQVVRRHSRGTLTPHGLRRRFAVAWLLKGGSETSLMRIAGWSSRQMITLYSRASADVIAADEFKRLMS
jgi:integrase